MDAFTILFGSGLPTYYVEFECHSLITEELKSQLQDSERKCSFRLKEALIIHGELSCDIVQQTVDECLAGIDKEPMVINEKDMPLSMQNFYDTVIAQQRLTMD